MVRLIPYSVPMTFNYRGPTAVVLAYFCLSISTFLTFFDVNLRSAISRLTPVNNFNESRRPYKFYYFTIKLCKNVCVVMYGSSNVIISFIKDMGSQLCKEKNYLKSQKLSPRSGFSVHGQATTRWFGFTFWNESSAP